MYVKYKLRMPIDATWRVALCTGESDAPIRLLGWTIVDANHSRLRPASLKSRQRGRLLTREDIYR